MKTRNLLVLVVTLGLGTLSAQAQERDGSRSFTDHLKQRITISRFGTVVSFTNSKGVKKETKNTFRICPRDSKQCTESADASSGKTEFHRDSPKAGTTLKEGETLIVTATVHGPVFEVSRHLTWVGGSSAVSIQETISALRDIDVHNIIERVTGQLRIDICPPPPGGQGKCPPRGALRGTSGKIELTKKLRITSGVPLHVNAGLDFKNGR